jgi:hypothetical protein
LLQALPQLPQLVVLLCQECHDLFLLQLLQVCRQWQLWQAAACICQHSPQLLVGQLQVLQQHCIVTGWWEHD